MYLLQITKISIFILKNEDNFLSGDLYLISYLLPSFSYLFYLFGNRWLSHLNLKADITISNSDK